MKKCSRIFFAVVISAFFSGCSQEDIIRVGEPFEEKSQKGVNFHHEITDGNTIDELRSIVENLKPAEISSSFREDADAFYQLDRPDEHVTEISHYIWFQEDGSAILFNEGSSAYYILDREETLILKSILEM